MSTTPRQLALKSISSHAQPTPSADLSVPLPEIFGRKVFNDVVQRRRMAPDVYQALRNTIERGERLDPKIADAVADAMKDWAVERGATHFTHWFQPMTGLTAEKHDSFLSPVVEGGAIHAFTGKELIKGEPDASSFPSGGIRATFEARGYTAWDPTSPAFLRTTRYGTTLCIPTAFCSWTGEALDTKTPLLRSCEALDKQARRLLGIIGHPTSRVYATMGPEQEYFLIDRELYKLRPDLRVGGRTLFGARPPKGQELEDHYFASTPERVMNFMMDVENELWQLGVPVKTRHNEVAPHQFELAPLYENVSLAVDHNMLTMEVLESIAGRHGFKCLLHEKPFAGVNGSGKHNNWSMADAEGGNLLDPGKTPHENMRFVICLTAIIRAIDVHQGLIRATYSSAGNDHRLGANEAPPAILSIFLGSELESLVESLIAGTDAKAASRDHVQLGVTTLPPLPKDTSDRNRTSPFAFTGNKFELRACGSSQTLAYPNTVINTAVAESFDHLATELEKRIASGASVETAVQAVVQETLTAHQRILFSGDNYTEEWRREAKERGLLNLTDTPTALERFASEENVKLFETYGVLSRREVTSRAHILFEAYAHRINVEAQCTLHMATTSVLPAAMEHQRRIADSIQSARAASAHIDLSAQETHLGQVANSVGRLIEAIDALGEVQRGVRDLGDDPIPRAEYARDRVMPAMAEVRSRSDALEALVDDNLWPLPKYHELLFLH